MKKIPTVFTRKFEKHRIVGIADEITPGCEEAFYHGIATIKIDGACCAIIDGIFYKRYDARKGKIPPLGAIPCCDPDPVTGHWPHWVEVDFDDPSDKWFVEAYRNTKGPLTDGTYEAIGRHFNGNPYGLHCDILEKHGLKKLSIQRSFEWISNYLNDTAIEGIVFWLNGEPVCKIKRSDFGYEWPIYDTQGDNTNDQ